MNVSLKTNSFQFNGSRAIYESRHTGKKCGLKEDDG
jgi:hypothetical protein